MYYVRKNARDYCNAVCNACVIAKQEYYGVICPPPPPISEPRASTLLKVDEIETGGYNDFVRQDRFFVCGVGVVGSIYAMAEDE